MPELNPIWSGVPNLAGLGMPGSITASSEANDRAAVEHLQDPKTHRLWISETSSPLEEAWIQGDFGGSVSIGHFGIFGIEFPFEAEVKLRLWAGDTPGVGDPVLATEWLDAWHPYISAGGGGLPWGSFQWGDRTPQEILANFQRFISFLMLNDAEDDIELVRCASWRLNMRIKDDEETTATNWQAAYLDISDAWHVSCAPRWGRGRNSRELIEATQGPAGNLESTRYGSAPGHSLTFGSLSNTEVLHRVERINAEIGTAAPMPVILGPSYPGTWWRDGGLYRLKRPISTTQQPFFRNGSPVWQTDSIELESWR